MALESVKVVVRCRPLNDRENAMNCKMVISIDSSHCVLKCTHVKEYKGIRFFFSIGLYNIK
uniref:Kinesin motor domain-containing protein n=1 Tax=Sinocyclocheilus grahami TaxID=75366 RepID=A0A672QQ59_SINGR